jgi:hypothetical protein
MARTRVVLRRNGQQVGEVVYASEAEAVANAAKMQGAASGLEALLAPASNRRNGAYSPLAGGSRGKSAVKQHSETVVSEDGTRRATGRNRKMRLGGGYFDIVRSWVLKERDADGKLHTVSSDASLEAAEAFLGVTIPAHLRRNPSIGRGTKHRDTVAEAIAKRLRGEGVPKREAVSRGFAIATAAELRRNPTPIDIASLDFGHFKKTVKIAGYYNVRTGRRFARVVSKDGTFVTDVPVADGGKDGSRAKGADAIKKRAYEQLRIHIQPTTWKPSVRVNPAGSVAYGGTSIRIHAGTYTVMPHGPSFSGPDGFVSAKKWIDTHGA